jgi:hypothetical protein
MGILSSMQVQHVQGAERTDNTQVEVKWAAVMAQERHYKRYLGVDLKKCRDNLDLANTSWNGAVKDYLYLTSRQQPQQSFKR